MTISAIIENTSNAGLPVEHGLSLFIQLENGRNVLFDMGQSGLFAENASRLGLNIADVDTAVISHGHYDHGGGLGTFLSINGKSDIFVHEDAFIPHYSLRESGLMHIGLDKELLSSKRIVSCGSLTKISDDMTLFADVHGTCYCPLGNKLLYEATSSSPKGEQMNCMEPQITHDIFSHEQNLIIQEGENIVLFAGCAHKGIVNIVEKAIELTGKAPTQVFAGMHLVKSGLNEDEETSFIHSLANRLITYKATQFYTMHCTGGQQFLKMKEIMQSQIEYLSCGDCTTISPTKY